MPTSQFAQRLPVAITIFCPPFARTVDIHAKPGYDPVELFVDMATKSIPLNANLVKGSHLPQEVGMHPKRRPLQPTTHELQENGRAFPPNYLHQSWRDFLYWDSVLETS